MNTKAWHEWRRNGIGGSDAGYIMGTYPKEWGSLTKLWEIKTGRRFADPANYPMIRGRNMEPIARLKYEELTGLQMPKDYVTNPKEKFVRASLDGINRPVGLLLEIKCPGRVDHASAVKGQIPEKYIPQLAHSLMASGLNEIDYFSYVDDKNYKTLRYKRNRRYEEKLLSKERKFWDSVLKDTLPSTFKEVSMKEKTSHYTAKEILDIMLKAKEIGATSIRLDGFEIDFGNLEAPPINNVAPLRKAPEAQEERFCRQCDSQMELGQSGHYYCKPCYIARKEAKKFKEDGPFRTR